MSRDEPPSRNCEQCGQQYTPVHSSQKYCSHKCGQRNAYERRKAILDAFRAGQLKPVKKSAGSKKP